MPNAKVLSEKQAIVAALTERIKNASAGVFVDYRGINVAQDTELRTELRKNDVEYSVIKNTLTRFALDDCGLKEIDPILNGTTSLATSTGDPIAPEDREKIFDRFWRADPAHGRETGGHGLGLAIARTIVETHKGKISVESIEGGNAFTVLLNG